MKMFTSTAIAAAVFAAIGSTAAMAEEPGAFTFSVQRASLDGAASTEAAYDRLSNEARRYCRSFNLETVTETQACVKEVVEAVVRQVGQPRLEQVHLARLAAERRLASADGS
ncbi:MAG: UrcA family protein [Pseudomonadota bacterium]